MNVRFLETFVWVARLRSFSSAADKLHTTQTSVSHRIATLERELGVRLFERDLGIVRLTSQGQNALARAEDIVRRVADFQNTAGDSHAVRGRISIGTIDSLVYAWIPRLIDRLTSCYPKVNIELSVDTSLHVAREVQDGNVDLGLIMGPVVGPEMRNDALCSYKCVWVAAPKIEFPERRLAFSDLAAYPLLAYSRGSRPHKAMLQLASDAGMPIAQLRIYNMNSIATQLRLLVDGMGVSALPTPVIREPLARGEIRVLDTDVEMPPLDFHAVYRPEDPLTSIVASMAIEVASEPLP